MRQSYLLAFICLFLLCHNVNAQSVPKPLTKEMQIGGKSFEQWKKQAKDANPKSRIEAAVIFEAYGAAALPELIDLLQDTDDDVCKTALYDLGEIGPEAKTAVPAITNILQDKSKQCHGEAIITLGKIGPDAKSAVPALVGLLPDITDWTTHTDILHAIDKIKPDANILVPELVRLLRNKQYEGYVVYNEVIDLIKALKPDVKIAVPAFIDLLRDKDSDVRDSAARAIGELPSDALTYVPAIIELFHDKDSGIRGAAADTIGYMGSGAKAAIPALVELLHDENAAVRRAASDALGSIGPEAKEAIPVLLELVRDKDLDVRRAVAVSLGDIKQDSNAVISAINELLKDRDSTLRINAMKAIANIKPRDSDVVISAIIELLKDRDSTLRIKAAEAIADIKPQGSNVEAVVQALIHLLGDENADVRENAARTLGSFGPKAKTAIPKLNILLHDEVIRVRSTSAWSLGLIGFQGQTDVQALADLLQDGGVRSSAIFALKRIGPEAVLAVPALTELCKENNIFPNREAFQTLELMGPLAKEAIPTLIQLVKDKESRIRENALTPLGKMGGEAKVAIPDLIDLLKDNTESNWLRKKVALALSNIGSAAVPSLIVLLKDEDIRTRNLAVWVLGEIGPESGAATAALTEGLNDKNKLVRWDVANTLGNIGPKAKAAIPGLIVLLEDKDAMLRRAGAKALGQIGADDNRVISALTKLLDDPNHDVRETAAFALVKTLPGMNATESEIKHIKELIAKLASIGDSEVKFASEPLFSKHRPKSDDAFISLVALGPAALPYLLESLDDNRPTKMTIEHDGFMGGMSLERDISSNPFNKRETNALSALEPYFEVVDHDGINKYTVKVGDICFCIIGQITNRNYLTILNRPSMNIIINSPVEDKGMAAAMREIWGKANHRQKLFDSLMIDLVIYVSWPEDAIRRLAYYYPETTEDLFLDRMNELEAAAANATREDAVNEYWFLLSALSHSNSAKIKGKLLDIFSNTKNIRVLLSAAEGVGKEHDELVFKRLTEQLYAQPQDEQDPYNIGLHLLWAIGDRFPDRAEKVIQNYLKPGTVGRCRTLIKALQDTCKNMTIQLLTPLLDDKRYTGKTHSLENDGNNVSDPIRVCDEAAEAIHEYSDKMKFESWKTPEIKDRQIEIMQYKIAAMQAIK
jgi:HEAT repeat protein